MPRPVIVGAYVNVIFAAEIEADRFVSLVKKYIPEPHHICEATDEKSSTNFALCFSSSIISS
jgi:hypothetical protein